MKKTLTWCLIAGFAFLGVPPTYALADSNFHLGTGFDYSSGKYGKTDATEVLSIPVVGTYQDGPLMLSLTVPYVTLTGTGEVVLGGRQGKVTSTSNIRRTTQSGIGDVLASVTYNVYSGMNDTFAMDASGRVKFGTASTKMGTGENDYAVQLDVYKALGRFTSMTTLGYEFVGKPAGSDLNNVIFALLGADYSFTSHTSGGAEFKASESYSVIAEGQRELRLYANLRISPAVNLRGYALKGFSDGSPDTGFGILVSSRF
jgi:hypothetical protein